MLRGICANWHSNIHFHPDIEAMFHFFCEHWKDNYLRSQMMFL